MFGFYDRVVSVILSSMLLLFFSVGRVISLSEFCCTRENFVSGSPCSSRFKFLFFWISTLTFCGGNPFD